MEGRELTLARIRIYPLKGAGGMDLHATAPDEFGLPGDRRWMLVRSGGEFVSQRTHPRLALLAVEAVDPSAPEGPFRVRVPDGGCFTLPEGEPSDPRMDLRLHQDRLQGRVPPQGGDWFSDFLGEPLHLVFIPPEIHRPVDPAYAPGHRTGFADAYPLLVTTEASLEALNRRLDHPSSMLRFRPNLVIRGADPWEEDRWRVLEIGGARIQLVKPCARCPVTLVDQETGERGKEPLRTLSRIRGWKGKAYFGQNGVFSAKGGFHLGQSVGILEEGNPRPPLSPADPPAP